MNRETYLVFHTAVDDSYMNSAANFRGAEVSGNTTIDMYFASLTTSFDVGGYDRVRLNITAGTEIAVIEGLAAACAGAKNPVTKVADDINSIYCVDGITSCGAITLASRGQRGVVNAIAAAATLYDYDAGKIHVINQASAFDIALPAASDAGAGWTGKFIIGTANTNAVTISATAGDGDNMLMSAHSLDGTDRQVTGADVLTFISGAEKGDMVDIVCDGTSWYCNAWVADDGHITLA